ncbi:MAG TPA: hypothetical protein PKD53_31365 [Chloroflexaceae bacterium]|nr:hypothetical protein [Chloroflexaceae bacterium]
MPVGLECTYLLHAEGRQGARAGNDTKGLLGPRGTGGLCVREGPATLAVPQLVRLVP